MTAKRAFDPVVDAGTRLLVLGSLPGDASLSAGQYYAHPRNAFWRLIGEVVGRDLTALAYEDRLAALTAGGVGLWDVIAGAERKGSLDSAIRNPEFADLETLVRRLSALKAVAFNGGTAARNGRRLLGAAPGVAMIDLPSSSPANASLSFAAKAAIWRRLSVWLD